MQELNIDGLFIWAIMANDLHTYDSGCNESDKCTIISRAVTVVEGIPGSYWVR